NAAISLFLSGRLDDFRLYNVARTQSAIQADMALRLTGTEPNLVAYLPLDEGTGTTAADLSGNGNAGSLGGGGATNMPAWLSSNHSLTVSLQGGTLSGSGTIQGSVTNAATVSPGSPLGVLLVNGAYTQTSTGTLNIDLAGTTPGTLFDQFFADGAATLGG